MSLSSEYEGKRQRFKNALQRLYNILSQEKMQYDDVAKGILESIFADLNMDDRLVKENVQQFEGLFVTPFGITIDMMRQAFAKTFFKSLTEHVKMQLYEINMKSMEQRLYAALQAETPKRPKDDELASEAKRVNAASSSVAAAASSSAAAAGAASSSVAAAASSSAAAAASSSAAPAASSSAAASRRRRRLSSDSSLD